VRESLTVNILARHGRLEADRLLEELPGTEAPCTVGRDMVIILTIHELNGGANWGGD
jgi:hypothetical protein